MSDEGGKQTPENFDNIDQVDKLEKDFQRVIQDIVDDHSLDNFRNEFTRLFLAVKKSHENNTALIDKCRSLNTEIMANSTKVNSVLQLSQDDERTIAGLRFEFEKAWKMVEISQEKENKSRDIIDSLKGEIGNLNKLIDGGSAMFLDSETSLESLQSEIKSISKEISMQNTQINGLAEDIQRWNDKINEMKNYTENSKEEYEKLNGEIDKYKDKCKSIQSELEGQSKTFDECSRDIADKDQTTKDIVNSISDTKARISKANQNYEITRRGIREENDMLEYVKARVKVASGLLEHKIKVQNRLKEQIEAIIKRISEKDEKLNAQHKTMNKKVKEKEIHSSELDTLMLRKKEVTEALADYRQLNNSLKEEIYRLTLEQIKSESKITVNNRFISQAQQSHTEVINNITLEKNKRVAIEGQQNGVLNDILAVKQSIHQLRKTMVLHNEEIEKYRSDRYQTHSNYTIIEADTKQRQENIIELNRNLSKIQERIKKHTASERQLIEQRDMSRRQLELTRTETAKLEDETSMIQAEIQELKQIIRNNDERCVSVHLQLETMKESFYQFEYELGRVEKANKKAATQIAQLSNTLVRTRYLRDNAEADVLAQKRYLISLESKIRTNENWMHSRVVECERLKEKSTVLINTINTMNGQYSKIAQNVQFLKEELIKEVEHRKRLELHSQHLGSLKLELLRLEKSVLLSKGQVKALEEELETPIYIHRWRFLEATNPEHAQLLKMLMTLRDKFMQLMAKRERLLARKRASQNDLEKKQKHIQTVTKAEHNENVKFFNSILNEKDKQLNELESVIKDQKSTVDDGKANVELLRDNLRATREEYFSMKRKNEEFESLSKKNTMKEKISIEQPRFIGGGFGVSIRRSLTLPKKSPIIPNVNIIEPQIQNTRKSAFAVKPYGWNPNRQALKPLLPTVSELNQ
ncbi:hypothetical protein TRFO_41464 [Tritrichomonas foetus]|uniref:Flagellar associated protein n=1 Tax=Tritrichomonas foetus TaxID=1144522 RepID=A0A1J4L1F1_9EUKA|nr:hypothetical protein TRFO_41464 [Tritrichomonas foetus]|eukprot:OHT16896.1 hypothetical protein TRFO_41464 [Tritrichomonas foetus]